MCLFGCICDMRLTIYMTSLTFTGDEHLGFVSSLRSLEFPELHDCLNFMSCLRECRTLQYVK